MPAKIIEIEEESIALEVGLSVGDELIAINGNKLRDILDFQYYTFEL